MREPLVRDDDLRMCPDPAFNPAGFPVPEYNVARPVAAADPLAVGRESHLACISRNRMPREALLAVLPEVVCRVDQDLVVQRLRGKVFFCAKKVGEECGNKRGGVLEGWSVTAGIECMCGSAMYLITTGMS